MGLEEVAGRRFKATLMQTSRALHWRGWEWDWRQAVRRRPVGGASMVVATWRGVTWAWPRRRARVTACLTTFAASVVRACCTVQPPALIFSL